MRFSKDDGGLLDPLNPILTDTGDHEMRKQVINVIRRDPLPGTRLVG